MSRKKLGYSGAGNSKLAGQFSVVITRSGADVAASLPFALFGSSAIKAGYQSILVNDTGATLVITEGLNNSDGYGKVTFAYTSGGNTDKVIVSSPTLQYTELISLLAQERLDFTMAKMIISGNADTSQFNETITMDYNNIFGARSQNTFEPNTYKQAAQLQANQIDIPLDGSIDRNTSLTSKIVQDDGLTISLTFFFENRAMPVLA